MVQFAKFTRLHTDLFPDQLYYAVHYQLSLSTEYQYTINLKSGLQGFTERQKSGTIQPSIYWHVFLYLYY